jgi:hypothetical protein
MEQSDREIRNTPDYWLDDLKREKDRVKAFLGLISDADLFRLLILTADRAVRERQKKQKENSP